MKRNELEALSTKTSAANGTSLAIASMAADPEWFIEQYIDDLVGEADFVLEESTNAFSAARTIAAWTLKGDVAGPLRPTPEPNYRTHTIANFGQANGVLRLRLAALRGSGASVTYRADLVRNVALSAT